MESGKEFFQSGITQYYLTDDNTNGKIVFEKSKFPSKRLIPMFIFIIVGTYFKYGYPEFLKIVGGGLLIGVFLPDFHPSKTEIERSVIRLYYKVVPGVMRSKEIQANKILSILVTPITMKLLGNYYYARVRIKSDDNKERTIYYDLRSSEKSALDDSEKLAKVISTKMGVQIEYTKE